MPQPSTLNQSRGQGPSHAPPEPYCEKHPGGTDDPCPACGRARIARQDWDAEQAQLERQADVDARRAEREAAHAAIRRCDLCDDAGYRKLAGGKTGSVCNHRPLNPGGLARAQAALAGDNPT